MTAMSDHIIRSSQKRTLVVELNTQNMSETLFPTLSYMNTWNKQYDNIPVNQKKKLHKRLGGIKAVLNVQVELKIKGYATIMKLRVED